MLRKGSRYLVAPDGLHSRSALAALRERRELRVLNPALPYLETDELILFQYPVAAGLDLLALFEEQNRLRPEAPALRRRVGRLVEWRRPDGQRLLMLEGPDAPPLKPLEDPSEWEFWMVIRGNGRLDEQQANYFALMKSFGWGPRRVQLLEWLREKATSASAQLLCSAGDEVSYHSEADDRLPGSLRDFEFGLLRRLGYSAIVPSWSELYWGVEELLGHVRRHQLPFVATNLERAEGPRKGEPIFPRYLLRQIGGLRVAILGLLAPDTLRRVHDPDASSALRITEPVSATNRVLNDLRSLPRSRPDLVLVLSTLKGEGP